jgi:acetyl-CoA acyltransferase
MEMRDVVIVAYGRSAATRAFKGSFAKMHPIEYGTQVLKGVIARVPQLDPADIEDVIVGCAMQFGETSMNIARLIVNRAELPDSVCGMTVNRFCSSGLQTISLAANAIACGQGDVYIAGGVESMSYTFGKYDSIHNDLWLDEHYPGAYMSMGITAENVARKYNITREEMDAFAVASHAKAAKAQAEGKLDPSIIPVVVTDHHGNPVLDENGNQIVVTKDEGIRPNTSMEGLANLKPCFITDGTGLVTAGTSSQTNDCAAFVVLMSAEKAAELGVKPLARLKSFAVAGCDATLMGLGPIYATPKALKRAGLTVDDLDVIEINEAFAAQSIPCIRELGLPMEKVNPYGGAIALGHPLGCTGAILVGKAIDYLKENGGKYGLITMCIGGGMGAAGVLEMC